MSSPWPPRIPFLRRVVAPGTRCDGRLAKLIGHSPDYAELYGMLGQAGRNVELATAMLRELMRAWPDGGTKRLELVDLEHENDSVTHDIVHHLHARPAVPFERSDVLALASGLDDVVDYEEEAADCYLTSKVVAVDGGLYPT
jgi:uncharacterized protein Yka (UPF0111/DUF47 family)